MFISIDVESDVRHLLPRRSTTLIDNAKIENTRENANRFY